MSEKRLGLLYFLAFVALALVAASRFAESVDNLLTYIAIPLFLLLSFLALNSWIRQRDDGPDNKVVPTWPKRLETFLRKLPPF